jgi:cadmium resistance protein CadD (predicted permease)
MQKFFGLIFIAVGVFGMYLYAARGAFITTDDKIAMLLGFIMILIGIIIIYADWKKKTDSDHERNS